MSDIEPDPLPFLPYDDPPPGGDADPRDAVDDG